jgi:hypothetical protein
MLRLVYRWLLRLHPARFRERFTEEMLSIFDHHVAEKPAAVKLLGDGFISLMRQWTLRSEYQEEKESGAHSATDGVPLFYTFESFKPRTSALIDGGILSLLVFCAVCLILRYNWTHPIFVPFQGVQFEARSDNEPSKTSLDLSPLAVLRTNSQQGPISQESQFSALKKVPTVVQRPVSPQVLTEAGRSGTVTPDQSGTKVSSSTARSSPTTSVPSWSAQTTAHQKVSGEILRLYAGMYATDPPNRLEILITAEHGELAIEVSGEPKYVLVAESGAKFVASGAANTWIEFVQRNDRTVYELNLYRNGRHITAHRTN